MKYFGHNCFEGSHTRGSEDFFGYPTSSNICVNISKVMQYGGHENVSCQKLSARSKAAVKIFNITEHSPPPPAIIVDNSLMH